MTTKGWSLLITGGAIVAGIVKLSSRGRRPMSVVASIDPAKYMGKWYEIARLPNHFERKCAGDITATYTLRPDGRIDVLNECRRSDGRVESARGIARPADRKGPNTKLKVSFFWPFAGNYWILDLDPDYRWALVGEPDRKYLWILSRKPYLEERIFDRLLDRAVEEGYRIGRLIRVAHRAQAPVTADTLEAGTR